MRNAKAPLFLFAALWLGLLSQNVLAQGNNLARVYFVTPKPGHGAELEAAMKEHVGWRKQQGDPWTWNVFQVINGDNLGDLIIRSGGHTWADFDAYDAGFGPKGGARFNETVTPHIETITSAITAVDEDNLRWPENNEDVNLISVNTYYLKPGQGDALTQVASKVHQAIVEHNRPAHYAWEWNVNGSEGQAVSLILPYKNWAAFKGPEEELGAFMARVMGPEEAKKAGEQFNGAYHATKSWVIRVRRDLSVMPDM